MKIPVNIQATNQSYDVIIERGAIQDLRNFFNLNLKTVILTSADIPAEIIAKVESQIPNSFVFKLPISEAAKTTSQYIKVLEFCFENRLDRNDQIIALGGGTVGDLAGFVASTYLRGIKFINIPTTLLAAVDSSIGGKTGINFENTKNAIGTFYQPEIVIIDLDLTKSLPPRQISNGLAEALKAGLIADPELFVIFEGDYLQNIDEICIRAVEVKRKIVENDEKESGERKKLNFGHTLGHGFESYEDFTVLLHGEAIANGLLYFIEDPKLLERTLNILNKMHIPVLSKDSPLQIDPEFVYEAASRDKKSKDNLIDIVKVCELGKAEIVTISKDKLFEIIKKGWSK